VVLQQLGLQRLGTIYERVSGRGIFEAFRDQIARPLEMEDFAVEDGVSVRDSTSRHAAYTFRMSALDLARFALLYMRGGRWHDRRLIPAEWVAEGTRPRSAAGGDGAYGQLWWAARDGRLLPAATLDSGTFAARGMGPHYAIVIPARELIIVHLANTDTPSPSNWVERDAVGALVMRILRARRDGGGGA
jgi:CubicO group peptidase (beta-lactamase class C family)